MASNGEKWKQARKILCVRPDALGDVLMTLPAIRAIRESSPDCELTLFTSTSGAVVQKLVSEIVDEVWVQDVPWMKQSAPVPSSEVRGLADRLLERGFDAAVIFTVYSQNPLPSAFICYLAEIPLRLAHCRENPYQLLTDWIPDPEPQQLLRHEVRRQLDLVAKVGFLSQHDRMELRVPTSAREKMTSLLRSRGLCLNHPWVVIHPGATAASRRYPPENYAEVSRLLIQQAAWQVVFTGGKHERELVEGIRRKVGEESFSFAGELSIEEFCALIDLAPILISNNSAPVHIAASVGTPVVDLYALTNPQHTPWRVPHRLLFHDVPCRYCYRSICPERHHGCLTQVLPQTVFDSAVDLHRETSGEKGEPPRCSLWESMLPFTTLPPL